MGGDGQCGQSSLMDLGGGQSWQASMIGSGHGLNPGSPSTGIASPGGSSTRYLDSSPSPSMTSGSAMPANSCPNGSTDGSSLDQFPGSTSSGLRPLLNGTPPNGTNDQINPTNLAFQQLF